MSALRKELQQILDVLDEHIAQQPMILFYHKKPHKCPKCGSVKNFGPIAKHLDSGNSTAQCADCGYVDCYKE